MFSSESYMCISSVCEFTLDGPPGSSPIGSPAMPTSSFPPRTAWLGAVGAGAVEAAGDAAPGTADGAEDGAADGAADAAVEGRAVGCPAITGWAVGTIVGVGSGAWVGVG